MRSVKVLLSVFLLSFTILSAQSSWIFDKPHSKIGFSVTHLVITEVEGNFLEFDGVVKAGNDNFKNTTVNLKIKIASIDTDISARDKHLRSPDFFDAEKYPYAKFKSKSFNMIGDKKFKMVGDLTIKDVTKEIVFDVHHRGTVVGPMGKKRAGFKISGEINRFDFNLKWNKTVEAGPIVDKKIKLIMNIELIKK